MRNENSLNQLRQQVEHNKELKQHINTIQRENADLKKDLTELVNMDEDDDEIIEVPDKKSKPQRSIICIIGTILSFFISLLTAYFIDRRKRFKG